MPPPGMWRCSPTLRLSEPHTLGIWMGRHHVGMAHHELTSQFLASLQRMGVGLTAPSFESWLGVWGARPPSRSPGRVTSLEQKTPLSPRKLPKDLGTKDKRVEQKMLLAAQLTRLLALLETGSRDHPLCFLFPKAPTRSALHTACFRGGGKGTGLRIGDLAEEPSFLNCEGPLGNYGDDEK